MSDGAIEINLWGRTQFFKLAAVICCFALVAEISAAASKKEPSPLPTSERAAGLEDFIRVWEMDRGGLERFYDLPWSTARFDRLEQLFIEWQAKLGTIDFEALAQPGRIDYLLMRNKLKSELARLALARHRLAQMEELMPFRQPLQELERARWRMEPVNSQTNASTVSAITEAVKKIRKRVEKGKKEKEDKKKPGGDSQKETDQNDSDSKDKGTAKSEEVKALKVLAPLAKRTAAAVSELRGTLKTWFTFYDGYQPDFSWWVKKPYDEAASALEDYAKYLREEIAGLKGKDEDPLIGDPVGSEGLADDLAAEMIPYSAEELINIGEKEFAWCQARMKEAAKEMGFGEDWKAALAKVKADFVPPGKQDELVVEEARRAITFIKERDLITVPALCEETWRLTMISPEGQKTMPYAAYSGQNMMVAYAKEEMKHEDKLMSMRGNNRHFTHITTPHELIPGHHLQHFVASRNHPYRSLFSTPFLVEGWSLYWEMLLWDQAYGQSPEDRVGMLFWRMHRAARIIVSLKFHLGKMTPAEMVSFLVDRVGHEKMGATSEVRRFIAGDYSPLYQCAYMIGGLQLRALHQEVVGAGRMTERQFHDAVLTYNAIPIEFIRAGLLTTPLAPDTQPNWKFAGEKPKSK